MTAPAWTLKFEVAFDTAPGSEPGAGDWTDLSGRLAERVSIERGSKDGQPSASATLRLHNLDRALDPTNPAASYNLVPMRHARLAVVYDTVSYPLLRGWIDSWTPTWPSFSQSFVDVRIIDPLAWLAMRETDLDLPAQTTSERIAALLDLAGWPSGMRDIGSGVVRMDPLWQQGANLRRALQDVADAEGGSFWIGADASIVFRSRHGRLGASSSWTFGPAGMKVSAVSPVYDTSKLTNVVRVELASGDVYEAEDADSVSSYGERDTAIRDLAIPKVEAVSVAEWEVWRYSEPNLWLDGITVESNNGAPDIWNVEIGDVATFVHPTTDGGTITVDGHVESIGHEVSVSGVWYSRFDLSPYFGEGPWAEWLDDLATGDAFWLSDVATSGPLWAP